jgi:hypothetical protein
MSRVKYPISKMQHTAQLILLFLDTVGRPARTSEIRKAVCARYPEAQIYSSLGELHCAGQVKRISNERDALFVTALKAAQ